MRFYVITNRIIDIKPWAWQSILVFIKYILQDIYFPASHGHNILVQQSKKV